MEAEREGFSRGDRRKLLKTLHLQLKSLPDRELRQVQALLVLHGFLLS